MRTLLFVAALLLVGCAPAEEENHQVTGDVDLAHIPALLTELADSVGGVDVESLVALTGSVAMDAEKQEKLQVSYGGASTTLVYHVWREQADWVHLYFSTPSAELAALTENTLPRQALQGGLSGASRRLPPARGAARCSRSTRR